MNLYTIAEMTIEAFYKDENVFYVVADALRSIGDFENGDRFHKGEWNDQDRIEAITIYHADLIETMKTKRGKQLYDAIVKAREYPYLVEYLLKQSWVPKYGYLLNMKTKIEQDRYIGKAARALYLLFRRELSEYHDEPAWLISKYRACVDLGLWQEAAKWRKLGKDNWQWQLRAA